MTNNYIGWSTLSNPALGTFTSTLVNHNAGVVVLQTIPSALHVLPSSYVGKFFMVQNATGSTNPVRINGITIPANDSAGFLWNGAAWDLATTPTSSSGSFEGLPDGPGDFTGHAGQFIKVNAGETALEYSNPPGSNKGQYARTISFSDPADVGSNVYNVGTALVANTRVERVVVEVVTPFNDPFATDLTIVATGGFTTLMAQTDVDIGTPGVYIRELPATQVSNGQIRAQFNADPNGNGGTQGQIRIYAEFGLI